MEKQLNLIRCFGRLPSQMLGMLGGAAAALALSLPLLHAAHAAPLTGVQAVAAGFSHSCALMSDGAVKCWGSNSAGQIGDGTTTDRHAPADVAGLAGVVAVAAGYDHSCALVGGGGVKCWGDNQYGQLGDGSVTNRAGPVDVSGLSGASAIAVGAYHSCALVAGGAVKCWGRNVNGQLGDGSTTSRRAPVSVVGLSGVSAVAGGYNHSCAVISGGAVKCWGDNVYGQIGDASTTQRLLPVSVVSLGSGVTGITAGFVHSCALLAGGGANCWGGNYAGQVGNGSFANQLIPAGVFGISSGAVAVSAGAYNACALFAGGTANCWGGNSYGALGNGGTANSSVPTVVSGLSGATSLSAGGGHTCAVMSGGGLRCWGLNQFGQLGDGTSDNRLFPVDVSTTPGGQLVSQYYQFILGRAATNAEISSWVGEVNRVTALGVDAKEGYRVLPGIFFRSAEYLGSGSTDSQYVDDLYWALFNRAPDSGGLAYWTGELGAGLPRDEALFSFLFSAESNGYYASLLGSGTSRAEADMVMDFYRGMVNRLPDSGGFNYWLTLMRTAQCQGISQVNAMVNSISSQFLESAEYVGRGRSNVDFVSDMYYTFMRRGATRSEVNYWTNELNSAALTRDGVRNQFLNSAEFQVRVNQVVAQGCLP